LLGAFFSVACGIFSGPPSPGGPDSGAIGGDGGNCGPSCDPPTEINYQPEGAALPPTVDDEVAALTILESSSITITEAGGQLALPGGLLVTVPVGAMPTGATLDVQRHQFNGSPPGTADEIYRFVASAQPTGEVTLVFPIPPLADDNTPLETHEIYVQWYHGQSRSLVEGVVDPSAKTITVTTKTFSTAIVSHEGNVEITPPTRHVIKLPYYYQGDTGYCWSAALSMLMAGYGSMIDKPWFNAAHFGVKSEDGLDFSAFAYGSRLEGYVSGALGGGKTIERHSWWYPKLQFGRIKNYLVRNVMENKPTLVQCNNYPVNGPGGGAAHMVVVVGYEQDPPLDYVYVHNPSGAPYERILWSTFTSYISNELKQGTVTFAVADPMPAVDRSASILVPFAHNLGEGVAFAKRRDGGGWEGSSVSLFSWYVEGTQAFGMVNAKSKGVAEIEPDYRGNIVAALADYRDASSSEGSEKKSYSVGYEVHDAQYNKVHSSALQSVSLAAGATQDSLAIVPLKTGVAPREIGMDQAGDYVLTLFVEADGKRHDEAQIPIVVKDKPPEQDCRYLLTPDFDPQFYTSLNYAYVGDCTGTASAAFSGGGDFEITMNDGKWFSIDGQPGYDTDGGDAVFNAYSMFLASAFVPGAKLSFSIPFVSQNGSAASNFVWYRCLKPEKTYVETAYGKSGSVSFQLSTDCRSLDVSYSTSAPDCPHGYQAECKLTLYAP
jgi:hypothetical protein